MALKVTTQRPELRHAAEQLTAILERFLAGKTSEIASRIVGDALEVQAIVERAAELEAENTMLRQLLEQLQAEMAAKEEGNGADE